MTALRPLQPTYPTFDFTAIDFDALAKMPFPLVDRVTLGRRLDQITLAGFNDRLADLIDLLENGGASAAVIRDARQLHGDIAQHLGVAINGHALGANVGGHGHAERHHPCVDRSQLNVGVNQHGAVVFAERHGLFLQLGRLWAGIVHRVRWGGQP